MEIEVRGRGIKADGIGKGTEKRWWEGEKEGKGKGLDWTTQNLLATYAEFLQLIAHLVY